MAKKRKSIMPQEPAAPKTSIMHFYLSKCPIENEKETQEQMDLASIVSWDKDGNDLGCSCGFATINSDSYGRSVRDKDYFCHLKVEATYNPDVAKKLEDYYTRKGILLRTETTEESMRFS